VEEQPKVSSPERKTLGYMRRYKGISRKNAPDRSTESLEKEIERWQVKYKESESVKIDLEEKYKYLQMIFEAQENEIRKIEEERDLLQCKVNGLHVSYVKSVNSIGTGLNPISDQDFKKDIRHLQDKVRPPVSEPCFPVTYPL
jgi:hypothetical protein